MKAFGAQFYRGYPKKIPNYNAFKRHVNRFCDSGHTRPVSPQGSAPATAEEIAAVKLFFEENSKAHIKEAEKQLGTFPGLRSGTLCKMVPHVTPTLLNLIT